MNRVLRKMSLFAMITSLFLAGCAAIKFDEAPNVAVDPNDSCERYRQPLRRAEEEQRNALSRVVNISVANGFISYMTCKFARQETKDCAMTASGTTLIGALVGIQEVEAGKRATQTDVLRGIDKGSAAFSRRLGNLGSAAHNLYQCRQKQIRSVETRFKKRKIDRQAAKDELADIESKLEGDEDLINALLDQNYQLVDSQLDARATASNLRRDEYVPNVPKRQPGASAKKSTRASAKSDNTHKPSPARITKAKDNTQKAYNAAVDFENKTEAERSKTANKKAEVEAMIG